MRRRRGAANKRKLNPIIIVTHSPVESLYVINFFLFVEGMCVVLALVVVAYAIYERIVLGRGDHTTEVLGSIYLSIYSIYIPGEKG
jgi:hypothetical protein